MIIEQNTIDIKHTIVKGNHIFTHYDHLSELTPSVEFTQRGTIVASYAGAKSNEHSSLIWLLDSLPGFELISTSHPDDTYAFLEFKCRSLSMTQTAKRIIGLLVE